MTTSFIIDSVADATTHRDRDALDGAVARLLFDYVAAQRVSVYRLLADGPDERVWHWLSLARDGQDQGPDDVPDPELLPRAADTPHWRECVATRTAVHLELPDGSGRRSVFPILDEQNVLGLLEVDAPSALDARDERLVTGILRIVRNHLALLDYGELDTLTGLLNRKTFDASFDKLRTRAEQAGDAESSWVGVADIDHFKAVNDTYGHLFGDEVLLLVSRLMRECFRGADQMFRFGGEEFVIVLDRASADGADAAFNRFRAAVAAFAFPQVGKVTVSLGYTRLLPTDGSSTAVERADAALYYGKQHGRDQVRCYESLLSSGELARKRERAEIELF